MKVCFFTLGCKVNQHETGALQELFRRCGYEICGENEVADVYVVNSCTVTATGDKKSLQWLRRAKRDNPQAVTVLTGCYPQAFPEQAATAPADIILGNTDRNLLVKRVEQFMQDHHPLVEIAPHCTGEQFEELPAASLEGHTRAFLKIEDGCNRFCAYCIIPMARGRVRSREQAGILQEMTVLAQQGYREFVLSGINLSCYGTDTGTNLAELVEQAAAIPGVERIRLGSLEPDLVSDEVWVRLSKVPQLCPQFHLSLQSGCDATLQRMRRHYTAAEYARVLNRLRELFEQPALTTDIIVGFPGETEEDFLQSLHFVQSCRFLKVHVFSYSIRPGTAAAEFPDQVSEEIKTRRSRQMAQAADEVRDEILQTCIGVEEEVLLEKPDDDGFFTGYTRRYIPVRVKAPQHRQGDLVRVRLQQPQGARLHCELLN